jgi:tripartite ATP-independent transporter DctM subunit
VALNELKRIVSFARHAENGFTIAALLVMALLPSLELLLRTFFNAGIPGSSAYVQNLTLWVGFLGAMIASSERHHLNLSMGMVLKNPRLKGLVNVLTTVVSAAVTSGLFWASLQLVRAEMDSPVKIAGWLPIWVVELVLPISLGMITLRFVAQAEGWTERALACIGIPAAIGIGFLLVPYAQPLLWFGIGVLVVSALFGAPIFIVLGGTALMLFFADGVPIASIPVETYRIVVSPSIPAIPLFTLTGFIVAEGRASQRLVRLFRALFGWMPGGLAIVTTLVCAFFTTFTGASGVTILALGGLLLPVLLRDGYHERFSVGLLTAGGSLGLLFPPSLPVILYGVVAHVPIPDIFKAGVIPGTIMVASVCIFGVREGLRSKTNRPSFNLKEAFSAFLEAKWEILIPVLALVVIFGGLCTLIEAAAITAVYALFIETCIHRELHITRDLPHILLRCSALIGGVFIILGLAMGLTNYMIDAEVPMKAANLVQAHIQSRMLFLLFLNFFLLIVGCLMDIFSAIVVVVPLILPISQLFDIHPLHLGMIFLANLELGYLTPPVGMNLFLASYRFDKPLIQIYRHAIPFFLVLLGVVLFITYIPTLTIGWGSSILGF